MGNKMSDFVRIKGRIFRSEDIKECKQHNYNGSIKVKLLDGREFDFQYIDGMACDREFGKIIHTLNGDLQL
jgi:hypothetical protein